MGEEEIKEISEDKLKQKVAEILSGSIDEREKIRKLYGLGYNQVQLWRDFGFARSTVYDELPVKQSRQEESEEKKDEVGLPVVLKNGKGEVLSPEAVYRRLVIEDGVDGERDFKALMKWAACIQMVQRMTEIRKAEAEAFAETVKPMLDMMEKSRQELDAAAARARESSMAIAEAAAMGAAGGVLGRIDARFEELKQQRADIATVQKPMQGLMARTMEMMMQRLTGMVFGGGGQAPATPGLVDKRVQQ